MEMTSKARNVDQVATTIHPNPNFSPWQMVKLAPTTPLGHLAAQVMLGFLADAVGIVAAS
jgi:hypothetical protein